MTADKGCAPRYKPSKRHRSSRRLAFRIWMLSELAPPPTGVRSPPLSATCQKNKGGGGSGKRDTAGARFFGPKRESRLVAPDAVHHLRRHLRGRRRRVERSAGERCLRTGPGGKGGSQRGRAEKQGRPLPLPPFRRAPLCAVRALVIPPCTSGKTSHSTGASMALKTVCTDCGAAHYCFRAELVPPKWHHCAPSLRERGRAMPSPPARGRARPWPGAPSSPPARCRRPG